MTSWWEVLELLRRNGGEMPLNEITRTLGGHDIWKAIQILEKMGYVEKIPLTPEERKKRGIKFARYLVRLKDAAYQLLKRYNVESFYDLPFAKEREKKLMKYRGRTFKRFDEL